MITPPFGMDAEVTQIRTKSDYGPNPYGRPECYEVSIRPCQACPWRSSCKNAEGRI